MSRRCRLGRHVTPMVRRIRCGVECRVHGRCTSWCNLPRRASVRRRPHFFITRDVSGDNCFFGTKVDVLGLIGVDFWDDFHGKPMLLCMKSENTGSEFKCRSSMNGKTQLTTKASAESLERKLTTLTIFFLTSDAIEIPTRYLLVEDRLQPWTVTRS